MKNVKKNNKNIVNAPKIIVLPMLKNVEATIVGTINKMENGLNIPPVKNNRTLNCKISYIKKEVEYKSFKSSALILNCKKMFDNNPINITR